MDYFHFITPFIYFLLIIIWSYILYFYSRKIIIHRTDKLLLVLLVVLAIDAFRTLFESLYFGIWYTSLEGFIPIAVYDFLAQSKIVFFPKFINLLASFIVLMILIKKWIPAQGQRQKEQEDTIRNHTRDLQNTIDELNKAKTELSDQKQLFEIMFNSIPDGIVITDTDRRILMANKGVETTFGYSSDEVLGRTTEFLYADSTKFEDTGERVFNRDAVSDGNLYTTEYKTKDNVVFPGETLGAKLYDQDKTWKGNLGIIRNISERQKYIDEIREAKDKAEENDRLKSAFLANMSHEIRTPMNGILGFTDLLNTPGLSGDEQLHYIEVIQRSGRRMLDTINDIIEISKIETGQSKLTYAEVDVTKKLQALYNFFRPEAQKKGLNLVLKIDLPANESVVTTDGNKVNSILTNLIKNAIKFTSSGSIRISCNRNDFDLEFIVADDGIGISGDRQKAIFERFVQADMNFKGPHEGSGLGLAITKSYAEQLGGKVWVKSAQGIGSTFYVTIPYRPVSSSSSGGTSGTETIEDADLKPLNVLVAEDDDTSFLLLGKMLSDYNFSMIRANNGEEAIEKIRGENSFDLILMDIKMPVMDGIRATEEIRTFNKTIPIIGQSAYALEGDRERALEIGFNDYITKPIKKTRLIEIIRSICPSAQSSDS